MPLQFFGIQRSFEEKTKRKYENNITSTLRDYMNLPSHVKFDTENRRLYFIVSDGLTRILYDSFKPANEVNLPESYDSEMSSLWLPQFRKLPMQTDLSFNEQLEVT